MKKITALMAALALLTAAGCTQNGNDPDLPSAPDSTVTADAPTDAPVDEDPAYEYDYPTAAPEDDPAEDGGAVTVDESSDDAVLLSAAQELFDSACQTYWSYTVGCPYDLDETQTAKNSLGWDFFLVTTPDIDSLEDVRADYRKVFSADAPDPISETYIESDGHVYCLNGARGSDYFYEGSQVTGVAGQSDGEYTFNVTHSYRGDDYGNPPYTEEAQFTIVREPDGAWRVQTFKLPF